MNNKFIIIGRQVSNSPNLPNLSLGGNVIKNALIMGCFTSYGQFLYKKENTQQFTGGFYSRIQKYAVNDFVFACDTKHLDTFDTYIFKNLLYNGTNPNSGLPGFLIFDTLGNVIKGKNASALTGASEPGGVSIVGNRLYFSGTYTKLRLDSTWFQVPSNGGSDIFMAGLDTGTLSVVSVDSLKSDFGNYEQINSMVSDRKGNMYIGGTFPGNLTVNGTTLNSAGGQSDFFIAKYGASNCGTLVPLKLLTFTAQWASGGGVSSSRYLGQGRGAVRLQWTTAQEQNVSHFEIERSSDGRAFIKIKSEKAKAKSRDNAYEYTDNNPTGNEQQETLFYRLKMVDQDGQYTYSPIRQANIQPGSFSIYPNPAKEVVYVKGSGITAITLTDGIGKIFVKRNTIPTNYFTLPLSGIGPGIYFLTITDSRANSTVRKVVVE